MMRRASIILLTAGISALLAGCGSSLSSPSDGASDSGGVIDSGAAGGKSGSSGTTVSSGGAGSSGRGGASSSGGTSGSARAGAGSGDTGGSSGSRGSAGSSPSAGAAAGGGAGSGGAGGIAGAGGATASTRPCDIYASGNTPCVAAHSTVRALFGAYSGNLYQVRRASDKTTKDIPVVAPGGFADSAAQDTFCAGTTCTISAIYDQSAKGNHLRVTPPGGLLPNGGKEANATAAKINLSQHPVYGLFVVGNGFVMNAAGVGYRNNNASGIATGDQPEGMYMVANGKHYNQWCCFDYGNAETNSKDNGPGTMEAVYFGSSTQWGRGSGSGPWVMADLEDGVFAGQSKEAPATNTPLIADYVTVMLKGKPGGFNLKGGNAQSGALKTMYDGKRPAGYDPMKKEGAIILGIGGDNSNTGDGTFFEGCMTSGYPTDSVDDAIQANVVSAGYGR
jgi:hypothetical protein